MNNSGDMIRFLVTGSDQAQNEFAKLVDGKAFPAQRDGDTLMYAFINLNRELVLEAAKKHALTVQGHNSWADYQAVMDAGSNDWPVLHQGDAPAWRSKPESIKLAQTILAKYSHRIIDREGKKFLQVLQKGTMKANEMDVTEFYDNPNAPKGWFSIYCGTMIGNMERASIAEADPAQFNPAERTKKFKCPICKVLIDIPFEATEVECPNCGTLSKC
jgi:hypothetical protein